MPSLLSLAALLCGSSVLLIGNGLQGLLIPVRAGLEGFSVGAIGLIAAAYSAGFVIGCVINPAVVHRVGHIRSFAVFAAVAAAVVLGHSLVINEAIWFALRMISGVCFSGLFMVVESWLNERATPETRGRLFGTYLVTNLGSITLGMLLFIPGDPKDFQLFAVTAIAVLLALVPVSLTTTRAPTPIVEARLRPLKLLALSPVGVFGCLCVGLANGSFAGLAPLAASSMGMNSTGIAAFAAAAVLGGAAGQYPIGRLSDAIDRRKVMIGACGAAILLEACLVAIALDSVAGGLDPGVRQTAAIALSACLGLFLYPLYGVSVSHTNDYAGDLNFVVVSSGLLLTWGIGASLGPVLSSQLMGVGGPAMLFVWMAGAHALLALFALFRMTRRASLETEEKTSFAPVMGQRVTPTAYGLHPSGEGLPVEESVASEDGEARTEPPEPAEPPEGEGSSGQDAAERPQIGREG